MRSYRHLLPKAKVSWGGAAGSGGIWLDSFVLLFSQGIRPRYRSRFQLGLVVSLFADLYVWGHTYNPTGKVADLMPPTPGIVQLQQQIEPSRHRVLVYQRHDQILIGMGNSLSNLNVPVNALLLD